MFVDVNLRYSTNKQHMIKQLDTGNREGEDEEGGGGGGGEEEEEEEG